MGLNQLHGSRPASADDIYEVQPLDHPPSTTVSVPGSKSQTNRALLLAALAAGRSTLSGALFSDDSSVFVESLRRLGFAVRTDQRAATIEVMGLGGHIPADEAELFVGNAGTTTRFLTAFLPLGRGTYLVDGTPRMRERPIGELLEALRGLGADLEPVQGNGCLPIRVRAAGLPGGAVAVDASRSGQFLVRPADDRSLRRSGCDAASGRAGRLAALH